MKKFYTLILLALSFFSQAQLALDSGLVACYSLNGHGADAINGLHGTVYQLNPATNRLNVQNACLSFSCVAQAFLELPNSPLLKSQQLSFSAWIKPAPSFYTKGYVLYTAFAGTTAPGYALTLESVGNVWSMKLRRQGPGGLAVIQSTTSLALNNWVHVGFSLDNFQMRLFINGISQGSVSAPGAVQYATVGKVYLGATNEPNHSEPFCGAIDNVRFYNRNLSAQEFLNLKNADPACISATLPPVANFTASAALCVNQPLQFTDLSTNAPDAWIWSCSGAVTTNAFSQLPVFTFTAPGTYTMNLQVSNVLGTGTKSSTLIVNPQPIVTAAPAQTVFCRQEPALLTASGAQTYTWSIGQSTMNPLMFIPSTTTLITINGKDSLGCVSQGSLTAKVAICHYYPGLGVAEDSGAESIAIFRHAEGNISISAAIALYGRISVYTVAGLRLAVADLTGETDLSIPICCELQGLLIVELVRKDGGVLRRKLF